MDAVDAILKQVREAEDKRKQLRAAADADHAKRINDIEEAYRDELASIRTHKRFRPGDKLDKIG